MAKADERYVDGFVLVVPKSKLAAYKKMAVGAGKVWKKYGALDYKECVGEDLSPKTPDMGKDMKPSTFPQLTKLKPNETVVFSYIVYRSRAHRDKVNARVMKEFMNTPGMENQPMPFDVKRTYFGGFKVIVNF